jgi:hypothetical protein
MDIIDQDQYEETVKLMIQHYGFQAESLEQLQQFRNLIYKVLVTYEKLYAIRKTGFGEQ